MRWLSSLVIGLGILIVLGVCLLAFGFYKKSTDPSWRLFAETPPPALETSAPTAPPAKPKPTRTPIDPFGEISLNLEEGCVISEVIPSRRYAYLMIGPTPACNRMVLFDLKRGRVLGSVSPR